MSGLRRLFWPGDSALPSYNWLARWLGYAWIGVVIFGIYPAHERAGLIVRAITYGLAALGLLGWLLLDYSKRLAPHRARALPVFLGVITTATGFASATGGGAAAMVIYGFLAAMAAAADASFQAALAVTTAGILAAEVGGLAAGGSYGTFIGIPVSIASGLLVGRNRAAHRIQAEQTAALLAQRERLEEERRRADVLDERARIAREIHDVLAHSLGALGIQIQAARLVLTDQGDIAQAGELLAAAQRMAAEGLVETRRAVSALRSGTQPLDAELALATSSYARRYGVAASLDSDGPPRPVPPDATVALLRVAQEALVNAAKHAPGQPVTVRLAYEAAGLRLTVRNNLTPRQQAAAPPPHPHSPNGAGSSVGARAGRVPGAGRGLSTADTGYGLTSMRERLRLLGGTLNAGPDGDSSVGTWTVTAWLPQPEATAAGS
jgi:signal transduction histidine kinase